MTARVEDIFSDFSFSSPLTEPPSDQANSQGFIFSTRDISGSKKHRDYDPYENIELVKDNTQAMLNKIPPQNMKHFLENNNLSGEDVILDSQDDVAKGARPKQSNTMDIRRKISEWYEEAEKEVERDLSLDISQLEIKKSAKRRPKLRDCYEGVAVGDDEAPRRPTMTLLRDFDPCFDTTDEEHVDVIYDQIDEGDTRLPVPRPRTKLPPQEQSKKINFGPSFSGKGPPKPPRSFSPSQDPSKSNSSPTSSPSKPPKSSPTLQGLKSMLSESNILKKSPQDSYMYRKSPAELHNSEAENIYIQVPVLDSRDAVISNGELNIELIIVVGQTVW